MSKTKRLLTPLECMQIAWGTKLRDFRQWCQPTSQGMYDWKRRRLEGAINVAETSMMDEVEAMLKSVQKNDNAKEIADVSESGTSVYLPMMMTAISAIESPPEHEQVIGMPYWVNCIVPTDPLQRVIQMCTTPAAYRCQVAYFSPDPHGASHLANQFINYWKHEGKRTFGVSYELGFAGTSIIKDEWNFRVLDNTLFPDKAKIDAKNLHVVTIDCTIIGVEPIVVGLGGDWDNVTDTGEPIESLPGQRDPSKPYDPLDKDKTYDPNNPNDPNHPDNPNNPNKPTIPDGVTPLPGGRLPPEILGSRVTEADILTKDTALTDEHNINHTRVIIDPDTKIITQTSIDDVKGNVDSNTDDKSQP